MSDEILVAHWASRQNRHWVKVYADFEDGKPVMWFETDDSTAWGTIDYKMSDEKLLDWIKRFAEQWGKHHHAKLKERMIEEDEPAERLAA